MSRRVVGLRRSSGIPFPDPPAPQPTCSSFCMRVAGTWPGAGYQGLQHLQAPGLPCQEALNTCSRARGQAEHQPTGSSRSSPAGLTSAHMCGWGAVFGLISSLGRPGLGSLHSLQSLPARGTPTLPKEPSPTSSSMCSSEASMVRMHVSSPTPPGAAGPGGGAPHLRGMAPSGFRAALLLGVGRCCCCPGCPGCRRALLWLLQWVCSPRGRSRFKVNSVGRRRGGCRSGRLVVVAGRQLRAQARGPPCSHVGTHPEVLPRLTSGGLLTAGASTVWQGRGGTPILFPGTAHAPRHPGQQAQHA
jgi:hypothetical protein